MLAGLLHVCDRASQDLKIENRGVHYHLKLESYKLAITLTTFRKRKMKIPLDNRNLESSQDKNVAK